MFQKADFSPYTRKPAAYYNVDKDFRIFITTETNEKFMALIDPSETIEEMNKKISTIYNSNYDQKKTIRNSFLNDYLLPKQLKVYQFIKDSDAINCTFGLDVQNNLKKKVKNQTKPQEVPNSMKKDNNPIKKDKTPIKKDNNPIKKNNTPIGKNNTPIEKDNALENISNKEKFVYAIKVPLKTKISEKKEEKIVASAKKVPLEIEKIEKKIILKGENRDVIKNKEEKINAKRTANRDLSNPLQKKVEKESFSINIAKNSKLFENEGFLENLNKVLKNSNLNKNEEKNQKLDKNQKEFQRKDKNLEEIKNLIEQKENVSQTNQKKFGQKTEKNILENNEKNKNIAQEYKKDLKLIQENMEKNKKITQENNKDLKFSQKKAVIEENLVKNQETKNIVQENKKETKSSQKKSEIIEKNMENNEKIMKNMEENLKASQKKIEEIIDENLVNNKETNNVANEKKRDSKSSQNMTEIIEENLVNNEEIKNTQGKKKHSKSSQNMTEIIEENNKESNIAQENMKELKPSQKFPENTEENLLNKEKIKNIAQENKKEFKPSQNSAENTKENLLNKEKTSKNFEDLSLIEQKTIIFPENKTPEKKDISNEKASKPIEKPQTSYKKNFHKSPQFQEKNDKSHGKLLMDLTEKTYKNNLIDVDEKVKKPYKTPEKKSNEVFPVENLHSKEITLKEYDPNLVKKTIEKLTVHDEEKNQEQMTEKKEQSQKTLINLEKIDSQTKNKKENSKKKSGKKKGKKTKKIRKKLIEKNEKKSNFTKKTNIVKKSDLIELSSNSERESEKIVGSKILEFQHFFNLMHLHLNGELDEIIPQCQKETKSNESNREEEIDLKEFEIRNEAALADEIDEMMLKMDKSRGKSLGKKSIKKK